MKKIILFITLVFITIGIFGQNGFKYEVQANGGIRVGGPYKTSTNIRIDSIISNGTSIIFYSAGDTLDIYKPYEDREIYEMLELDTALFEITTPENTGTIVAGTGITVSNLNYVMYFNTAAPINISSNPQIADGIDGQIIRIVGSSDTNTLTLDDGTGLQLAGGASFVLGLGDVITLIYIETLDLWLEVSRSNN